MLAREVTTLAHGEAAATAAEAAARALFGGAPDVDDANIPTTEITATEVAAPCRCADLFVRAGLVPSRGEARRKAAEGALWMDGERVEDVDEPFQPGRERYVAALRQEALPAHSHRALIESVFSIQSDGKTRDSAAG